ncbi:hypothetical protein ABZ348_28485 [Streptomyces sp. NPDC005963]|uniref:hypothetical protein n=1 Tax=Streptomyces sp. NPDC005963 TaxID=3156721 RepID=UPI003411B5D7
MYAKRQVLLTVAAVLAAGVMVAGTGVHAAGADDVVPESDLAHHGHASLTDGRLRISLVSTNLGPRGLADSTARLELSTPLADAQSLPHGCLQAGDREVLCTTGPLRAGAAGFRRVLHLRTADEQDEVIVTVGTRWNGGVPDPEAGNHEHDVLVPATGAPYAF